MRTNFNYKTYILENPVNISVSDDTISVNTCKYCFTANILEQKSYYNKRFGVYDYIKLANMPAPLQSELKFYGVASGSKVYIHRLITYLLGNTNFKDVEIHHRNLETQDNTPSNLLALSKKDHNILHLAHTVNDKACNIKDLESLVIPIWYAPENILKPNINIPTRKINRIKTLYSKGYSYADISKKCKTSKSTISKILKTSDIKGYNHNKCTIIKKVTRAINKLITPVIHTAQRLQACLPIHIKELIKQVKSKCSQPYYPSITNTYINSLYNDSINPKTLFNNHKGTNYSNNYQYNST